MRPATGGPPAGAEYHVGHAVGGHPGVDRRGLEILDRDECLRLLATTTLGRVGITKGALPVIVPINFRLVGDRIVFRTSVGTKLDLATRNAVVAFEADHRAAVSGAGWSVAVTDVTREVIDPAELAELSRAAVPRWTEWGEDHFIVLSTERVSGRRTPPVPAQPRRGR